MVKIAYHTPSIDVRGTCVSLYDYAHYAETLLGYKSIVVVPKSAEVDPEALRKFVNRFRVLFFEDMKELDKILIQESCDILYCIKYGKNDGVVSNTCKTAVHCVFDLSEPHGDAYAAVSSTLAAKFKYPDHVPHMIGLRPSQTGENMRAQLHIPEDAIVFGRHGGQDTFDLQIAKAAISQIVRTCPDRYFVFLNTPAFDSHPNIHFLSSVVDPDDKNRFICTCDAMIHAQSLGETFGISIGEFSVNNKPVITYSGQVWNDHYRAILGDNAIYYSNKDECYTALHDFDPKKYETMDNNYYREYTPEKVMKVFDKVFVRPLISP